MATATSISRDDFERAYAERSGLTVEQLRTFRTVRPCACDYDKCEGWQSVSYGRAKEYDQNRAEGTLPPHLW